MVEILAKMTSIPTGSEWRLENQLYSYVYFAFRRKFTKEMRAHGIDRVFGVSSPSQPRYVRT